MAGVGLWPRDRGHPSHQPGAAPQFGTLSCGDVGDHHRYRVVIVVAGQADMAINPVGICQKI